MKRTFLQILVLTLFCIAVFGIRLYSKSEQLSILTNVNNAEIYVDGEFIGLTPFIGEIRTFLAEEIVIKKKDYNDFSMKLNPTYHDMFEPYKVTTTFMNKLQNGRSVPIFPISSNIFEIDLEPTRINNDMFSNSVRLKQYAIYFFTEIALDIAANNHTGFHLQNLLSIAQRPSNSSTIEIVQDLLLEAKGNKAKFGNLAKQLLSSENGEGC